ncbi:cupin domain-containing protein [Streptomyces sp. NPDC006355]|uniref:cupin domain-containing protein n=1 Tax=Streptomyces sp. NPDC006355 TaxID=3156758 RepID=UPI0033A884CC
MTTEVKSKRTALVRSSELQSTVLTGAGFEGVRQTRLIDATHGSVHQEVVIMELAPGGVIPGHFHPFEESFFMLEGEALYAVGGESYRITKGGYGFAPIAAPHAWRNTSDRPARWIEVRAPQPKTVADARGTYAYPELSAPQGGREVTLEDPTLRHVGLHEPDQMPPYGPIAMRGMVYYCVKHISARLLVQDALGAVQHLTFLAQLPPTPADKRDAVDVMQANPVNKTHYHQYEEVYHFLQGRGLAHLDQESFEVGPGDTILAGVGGSHAVVNIGDEPLLWLETMTPRPPEQNSMFWEKDWAALTALPVTEGS